MKKIIQKRILLKFLIIAGFILSFGSYFFVKTTLGERAVFYKSGELINLDGEDILVVPNQKGIEFISIAKDDKLKKITEIETIGQATDILSKINKDNKTIVSIEGDTIVEYDISDLEKVKVIRKYGPFWKHYDYYYDIAPYSNNRFLTAGEKGITIWDANTLNFLEKPYNKKTYNVASYNESIYGVGEEGAIIINAEREQKIDSYITAGAHQHKIFIDDIGRGYFPGDDVLKYRTFTSYKNLIHPSGSGNAVDGLDNSPFVYFANGWNIYKIKKEDLIILDKFENGLESKDWIAGVSVLNLSQGNRVVVYNSNNILLLDENLDILDKYAYSSSLEKGLPPRIMKISSKHGKSPNPVMVAGNGFWPGEPVILNFANNNYELTANNTGDVLKVVEIPNVLSGQVKISLRGEYSGYSYSAGFIVD